MKIGLESNKKNKLPLRDPLFGELLMSCIMKTIKIDSIKPIAPQIIALIFESYIIL
jgi:hypothetical protein